MVDWLSIENLKFFSECGTWLRRNDNEIGEKVKGK